MLPLIIDVFGIQFDEMAFFILLFIFLAVLVAAVVFSSFRTRSLPRLDNKEELYAKFAKLGDDKARMKARMAAVEETKNYGRISKAEYEYQISKIGKEIAIMDAEMDRILKKLAMPHYQIKLQQERSLETDKMSLLVKMQEETNAQKRRIEELEGALEDVTKRNEILDGENEELQQKLDNVESSYKDRVMRLEQELDRAKKAVAGGIVVNPGMVDEEEVKKYKEKMEEYYHKILLYQLLVSRYKGHIEGNETKTVPDVKSLVQPTNSNIVPIVQKIKTDDKDFMKQFQSAYEYVDEIHSVPYIGATLWLSVKEMLDNKVADYEDKAILLCSILRALGANALVLVALMTDGSNRPLVLLSMKDKSIMLDPNTKHDFIKFVGKRNDLIRQFSVEGNRIKRIQYEFNDKDYISYEA
jgi:regulator of replication initiation timing